MQGTQTASLDTNKSPLYVSLIVVLSAIPFDSSTGTPKKEPREVTFLSLCCLLSFWREFSFFSVMSLVEHIHVRACMATIAPLSMVLLALDIHYFYQHWQHGEWMTWNILVVERSWVLSELLGELVRVSSTMARR